MKLTWSREQGHFPDLYQWSRCGVVCPHLQLTAVKRSSRKLQPPASHEVVCWLITLNFEPQELVVPSLSLQRSSSSFCRLLWLIISSAFDWKEVSRKRKLKVICKLLDKTRKKNRLNYLFLNPAVLLILSPWFSWTSLTLWWGKWFSFFPEVLVLWWRWVQRRACWVVPGSAVPGRLKERVGHWKPLNLTFYFIAEENPT